MKNTKHCSWILAASLLVPVSVVAQQTNSQPTSAAPAAVQPVSTTPGIALVQPAPKVPVSVDQVVDQIVEHEHALIQFLKNRTPLVETYLQNLTPNTKLGSAPKQDHYFLGRLDMADTIDRRDYLVKQTSFERTLMGGARVTENAGRRAHHQPLGGEQVLALKRGACRRPVPGECPG